MEISVCEKKNLCVDCTEECNHAGDKVADCPRYPQACEIRKLVDSCDDCTWIDIYIDKMRTAIDRSKVDGNKG